MSILAVKQLQNAVAITQTIYITNNRDLLGCRMHILKAGTLVDGTVTVTFTANSEVIKTITKSYTDFNSLGANWHGMFALDFTTPIPVRINPSVGNLPITITITITGHTDSDTNYLGLVHEDYPTTTLVHDTGASYYPTYGNDHSQDVWNNPFGIEVYSLK